MNMFKSALRIVSKHKIYFLIYCVLFAVMGVFIALDLPVGEQTAGDFEIEKSNYAVIDRDNSELSNALIEHLSQFGNRVDIADDKFAMQDAVAKTKVTLLMIIPQNFESNLLSSVKEGTVTPEILKDGRADADSSYLVSSAADSFVKMIAAAAQLKPDDDIDTLISQVNLANNEKTTTELLVSDASGAPIDRLAFYLEWSVYTLTCSIMICIGVVLCAFNRTSLRQRNLATPVSNISANLQVALACFVVMVICWLFTIAIGLIAFGSSFSSINPLNGALIFALSFCFALFPLACGYLLGQLGANAGALNSIGNILGLVLSFLGGAWISLDLMSDSMKAFAQFTPGYWLSTAINTLAHTTSLDSSALAGVGQSFLILLLFAAAVFSIALVVAKRRRLSVDGGGNDEATAVA